MLLLVLTLFSCSRESFSVPSLTLKRDITLENGIREENALLSASIKDGDGTADYSFLLVSPDSDLRWEGRLMKMSGDDDMYSSDLLGITEGALLEDGSYEVFIYSSLGPTFRKEVEISREEKDYSYEKARTKDDVLITFYGLDGEKTESAGDAVKADADYTDRHGNRIHLRNACIL